MASEASAGAPFPGLEFPVPGQKFLVGSYPYSVAAADLNGDTIPDVVTANVLSDDVSVLLGKGDGTFHPAASFAVGLYPQSVVVGDLDGDSIPDIVSANGSHHVSVLLGNGDGTFRAAVYIAAGASPQSVAVADLDGDAIPMPAKKKTQKTRRSQTPHGAPHRLVALDFGPAGIVLKAPLKKERLVELRFEVRF